MKKSNYVTKYDYIAYYTKQPAMWFFSNAELEAAYKFQYGQTHLHDLDLIDEDDNEEEEIEFDSYSNYRETKDLLDTYTKIPFTLEIHLNDNFDFLNTENWKYEVYTIQFINLKTLRISGLFTNNPILGLNQKPETHFFIENNKLEFDLEKLVSLTKIYNHITDETLPKVMNEKNENWNSMFKNGIEHSFHWPKNSIKKLSVFSNSYEWTKVVSLETDFKKQEYLKYLYEFKNVDDINPLIVEGRIIDKKTKEFILDQYINKNNLLDLEYVVFDFDETYVGDFEKQFDKTMQLLKDNANVIIFQPVFIDQNLKIATRCDALVKSGNEILIIETKATSTAKLHHILDLYFQKRVIETLINPQNFELKYRLCLIKYELLNKKEISFIISETINLTKAVATTSVNEIEEKQKLKLNAPREKYVKRSDSWEVVPGIFIDEILNGNYDPEMFKGVNGEKKKNLIEYLRSDFNDAILKLWEHKQQMSMEDIPGNFIPSWNDKSDFKNTDMWLNLKKLYQAKGYPIFNYSGNVMDHSNVNLAKTGMEDLKGDVDLSSFLRYKDSPSGIGQINYQRFLVKNAPEVKIDVEQYTNLISKLKDKKVYFDFESINPSIRAIDNSLPFTQALTQNSVLKDHGLGVLNEKCINLVCDPNQIGIPWFKEIIDSLYEGEDYSYVVYNKNFEKKRLEEIANFIDEEEYKLKVSVINENMFDLADFFTISKEKEPILIKELGGYYSIKKVLPLVDKYANHIFEQTGCKDYKTLEISNGLMCQQKTMARFYNQLSDQDWQELVRNVSTYCENDVRAMVAVEYFITDYLVPKYLKNEI